MAGFQRAARLAVGLSLVVVGCGDSAREGAEEERGTAALVVGTTAAEWSLLTVPLPGGVPDLRPIVAPDSSVWAGQVELPSVIGVWRVGDATVVLRAADGRVFRYDAVDDDLEEVGRVAPGARAIAGARSVVFLSADDGSAFEVGLDAAHEFELPAGAEWAGSVEGGLAVLGNDADFWLLPRSDSGAVLERGEIGRAPALVTAWGRRLAVTGPDGRSLRMYALDDDLELIGEARLDGQLRALSVSPSSHELYAGVGDPNRLQSVSRFSFDVEDVVRLPGPPDRIRPGLFGGSLLVRTAAGSVRIPAGSDEAAALGGDWRDDLPLGLPGDLSIISVDEEARLVSAVDAAGVALAGSSPRWWIPVRHNPTSHRDDIGAALENLGAAAEGAPLPREPDADLPPAEVGVPDVQTEPEVADAGPPGYYAIVTSARQRSGVEELTSALNDAGYPVRIQSYPDEAGETWHRGLVGPYPSRARAQAAARQLLRERGLQAWVTEIGASE